MYYYLIIYVINLTGIFSILVSLEYTYSKSIENIFDISTVTHNQLFIALFFTVNLFSLAGIPPLAGFFPNFLYLPY